MKSLGASSRQLAAMYLGMALLLGLVAALIALPASIAIGRAYAALKADLLNFSIDGYAVPWWAVALQIVVGMALPVAAAAIPVLRGCRLSVSAALRDTGIAANGAGTRRQRTIGVGRIGRPLLLSIGNAFRRRQRLVLTLLALAAGGAVFLGAANLRSAVRASVDDLFSSQHFDAQLRLNEAHAAARLEQVAGSVDGVQGVEAWATARATVARDDGLPGNAFGLVAPPAATTLFVPPSPEAGRWLDKSAHNEMVSAASCCATNRHSRRRDDSADDRRQRFAGRSSAASMRERNRSRTRAAALAACAAARRRKLCRRIQARSIALQLDRFAPAQRSPMPACRSRAASG
jgi:putative ABC transport system permease protein